MEQSQTLLSFSDSALPDLATDITTNSQEGGSHKCKALDPCLDALLPWTWLQRPPAVAAPGGIPAMQAPMTRQDPSARTSMPLGTPNMGTVMVDTVASRAGARARLAAGGALILVSFDEPRTEVLSLAATLVPAPLPCAAPPTLPGPLPPPAVSACPPAPTAVGCTVLPSPPAAPSSLRRQLPKEIPECLCPPVVVRDRC